MIKYTEGADFNVHCFQQFNPVGFAICHGIAGSNNTDQWWLDQDSFL